MHFYASQLLAESYLHSLLVCYLGSFKDNTQFRTC